MASLQPRSNRVWIVFLFATSSERGLEVSGKGKIHIHCLNNKIEGCCSISDTPAWKTLVLEFSLGYSAWWSTEEVYLNNSMEVAPRCVLSYSSISVKVPLANSPWKSFSTSPPSSKELPFSSVVVVILTSYACGGESGGSSPTCSILGSNGCGWIDCFSNGNSVFTTKLSASFSFWLKFSS